jgi:hypothetical protein
MRTTYTLTESDLIELGMLGIAVSEKGNPLPLNHLVFFDTGKHHKSLRDVGFAIERLSPDGLAYFVANCGENRLWDLKSNGTAKVRELLGVEPKPAKSEEDITRDVMMGRREGWA